MSKADTETGISMETVSTLQPILARLEAQTHGLVLAQLIALWSHRYPAAERKNLLAKHLGIAQVLADAIERTLPKEHPLRADGRQRAKK